MVLRLSLALTTGLVVALASATSACAEPLASRARRCSRICGTAHRATGDPRSRGSGRCTSGTATCAPAACWIRLQVIFLTAGHCVPAGHRLAFVAGMSGTAAHRGLLAYR